MAKRKYPYEPNKRLMLVRYINARCYIQYFNSVKEAKRWVYQHEGISTDKEYSIGVQKRINAKIKRALRNKEMYCGGQWIELPRSD